MNSVANDLRKNISYFNECNPVSLNNKGDRYVIGDVEYPRVTGILGIIDKYGNITHYQDIILKMTRALMIWKQCY